MLAGCGGDDPAVETDPTAGAGGDATETVPPTVTPETPEVPEVEAPDYAELPPSEYGVDDVFFAFDEYDLSDATMSTLTRNARILREADVVVVIEGHCDERGTVEYNLALGEKRAKAVKDYLVSLGVPAANLEITSYGESKPFAQGSSDYAWTQNRRAHFARR
ncbi:MAG: OmpA family protein [bacterium]|nr:OmpA family protein [bacterium]